MSKLDNGGKPSSSDGDYRQRTLVSRPLFFSSTFRDMHAERDLLRNDAFLELNERLRERRHELNVIDLRQGIETAHIEDEAESELAVLKVCLDEIERTRPFLIGLLGDRYGWIPPAERMQAAAGAAGFAGNVAGRSVTELELVYAFEKNPEQRGRSCIYLRDLEYTGMPDEARAEYDERFAARNGTAGEQKTAADRWDKLQALKARLLEAYPDRVRTYRARWDDRRGVVTGLDDLRAMVVEDLWADLDAHTREYERQAPRTWQAADARALDDFVLERTRHYVERPAITDPAVEYALRPDTGATDAPWGLCFAGESGLGKSAVFSRIYQTLKAREAKGELLLLANAAGIYAGSGQVDRMLRRWIRELAEFLGIEDPLESATDSGAGDSGEHTLAAAPQGREPAPAARTREEIEEIFTSLLGQAATRSRVVVHLDALNQFERSTRARYLTWLPRLWPANVRLLATAIPGTETEALARSDRGQRIEIRSIPPIGKTEAREIARNVFQDRYHREPNPRALDVLLEKTTFNIQPAHGNPLWLELALQEINLLEADDFKRADREYANLSGGERMQALLVSEAERLPARVQDIYRELLARAGRTFGEAFTRAMLSFIALGRAGWRESDLQALVPGLTGEPWSDLAFAGVRRSLGHHLTRRGEARLWDFFHAQLRQTVLSTYIDDPEHRSALHARLAEYLQSLPADDPLRIDETMVHLIELGNQASGARYLAENQISRWNTATGKAGLAGAVAAIVSGLEGSEDIHHRERQTEWVSGLLDVPGSVENQVRLVVNVMIFDLSDALAVSGTLEEPRIRILEASRATLERLYAQNPNDAQAARDLFVSLYKMGDFYLRRGESGDAGRALESYQPSLEMAQRLYEQNPNDAEAARDLFVSYDRLGDFYLRRGESGDAGRTLESYQQSLEIAQRLYEQNPNDAQAARDLSVSLNKLGDFYLRRGESGDAGRTLESYQPSLEIAQRLYEQNPNDAQAARDLSVSYERLGDFYLRRGESGDAGRALESYQPSLETRQRLYEQNPNDAQAARDLFVSLYKMGDFYLRRGESGDAGRALESYQPSLEMAQRLYEQNPNDAEAARDLFVSYDRLGDFYLRRGESGDAGRTLESYQQSLEIAQRLYEQNPNDAQAARDLSVSYERLGDLYLRRGESGDAGRALESYQPSLEMAQRLYEQNPNDAEAARDLFVSLNSLGDFYLRRGESGDAGRALESYQPSLEMAQRLYEQNPNDAEAARDLFVSYDRLGDFYLRRGESGDAGRTLESYQQSLEIAQRLYEQNPNDAQAARDLSVSLNKLGDFYLRRGESGDAGRTLESYQPSLEIAQRLYEQNPNDVQAARDVVVSHYKLYQYTQQVQDMKGIQQHLSGCHQILQHMDQWGMFLDPPLRQLLEQLNSQ